MLRSCAPLGLVWCLLVGCSADPLEEVRAQQARGDLAGSIEPLRELLVERPEDPEVHYRYGAALVATGQAGLAEWSLRKAMADSEWLQLAGLQLATGALQTGNLNTAIEVTQRILAQDPDQVAALLLLANARAHAGQDLEQVLADVDRILELEPDNLSALEPRILALLALDRPEEAGEAIDELGERIEEAGGDAQARGWHCATRALFVQESGDIGRALELWSACLEAHPAHWNVVSKAVAFYDGLGQFARSLEALQAAVAAAPSARSYRISLAQRLVAVGRREEAESLLREATESEDPRMAATALVDLAEHYQSLGDPAAGARATEQAVRLAREVGAVPPQLLLEHADALLMAGELAAAEAAAAEMTVDAHRALVRARVAQERGLHDEAMAHYQQAFRLWPDNAKARYVGALNAEAAGDFDRAVEYYRYAIRIDPAATDSRVRLARLLLAEGKRREALQILRTGGGPLGPEGELLRLRVQASLGRNPLSPALLAQLGDAEALASERVLVAVAEGLAAGRGPRSATAWLRGLADVDLADPRRAELLRTYLRLADQGSDADDLAWAAARIESALERYPDAAATHSSHGCWLELQAAELERVRAAHARALELDAGDGRAHYGLGLLALDHAGDAAAALAAFERASATDPGSATYRAGIARALVALGRPAEAEAQLESLLALEPYDAGIAAELAELRLARGVSDDRTLALARRAARFGGGRRALELQSRLHRERGEEAAAAEAALRAREAQPMEGSTS